MAARRMQGTCDEGSRVVQSYHCLNTDPDTSLSRLKHMSAPLAEYITARKSNSRYIWQRYDMTDRDYIRKRIRHLKWEIALGLVAYAAIIWLGIHTDIPLLAWAILLVPLLQTFLRFREMRKFQQAGDLLSQKGESNFITGSADREAPVSPEESW